MRYNRSQCSYRPVARGGSFPPDTLAAQLIQLFSNLKRHNIYRVAAAYAVVAWVLGQLVGILMPIFDLPQSIVRVFILLLAFGFPVALFFAWANQLAPESGAAAQVSTGKLDWFLAGALVVVIALVSYQQLAPTTGARTAQQAGVAPGAVNPNGISIAVLPFGNLSGDAAQEFFSDGMTEEITAALAKVPDLTVIGRTSAFQFKGRSEDLRTIGQALSASYLIEGSVRKAGDRVRITAQLIRADNGTRLWTESYDRQLTDIFAIQEDIAQAIAGALRVPLGLRQGETLVRSRTSDLESYDQYLRAKALVRVRGMEPLAEATTLLEKVVLRDPNYAPARALLAEAYVLMPDYVPAYYSNDVGELRRIADVSLPKAAESAARAIQLAPNLADGYFSLGFAQESRGKWLSAEDLLSKAMMLDPDNPDALHRYANLLGAVGRLKESLTARRKLLTLEPFVPVFNANTAALLWLNAQNEAAIRMLEALPPGAQRGVYLSEVYASVGRYREAVDAIRAIPSGVFLSGTVENAARLLSMPPIAATASQNLPRLGRLSFVYLHIGAPDRALDAKEDDVRSGYFVDIDYAMLWHPSYAPLRKTERFKALVRNAGFVDYWRARGWPDLCHPVGADDFACD